MKEMRWMMLIASLSLLCGCTSTPSKEMTSFTSQNSQSEEKDMEIAFKIDETAVEVVWENNPSTVALKELSKDGLSVSMRMYGGFEQVGSLGATLPSDDRQLTTQPGDIVLYESSQIVIFYGSNSWSYTKLGHVNLSKDELTALLGDHPVTIHLE